MRSPDVAQALPRAPKVRRPFIFDTEDSCNVLRFDVEGSRVYMERAAFDRVGFTPRDLKALAGMLEEIALSVLFPGSTPAAQPAPTKPVVKHEPKCGDVVTIKRGAKDIDSFWVGLSAMVLGVHRDGRLDVDVDRPGKTETNGQISLEADEYEVSS